jgi:UDP-N-acetylglucosamine 2-epimerase (non-hydrolysing)
MDAVFFDELNLPAPKYNLLVGSGTHSNQIGNILIKIEPILHEECPDVVLVQGDTNTVMASALAAAKLGIKLGHIEAGLRSYDRSMPEETNRILTDHMSDFLFAVSAIQSEILRNEGIGEEKIFTVGNTIVDAVHQNLEIANRDSEILERLSLKAGEYILLTAHRAANVDNPEDLLSLVRILESLPKRVIWPVHLRTQRTIDKYKISIPNNVTTIEPTGYFDFLKLQMHAECIITDSGGVQEEACILKVPCITIRDNTERPETVDVGANVLVGKRPEDLTDSYIRASAIPRSWTIPFGDGNTAVRIIDCCEQALGIMNPIRRVCCIGMGYMGLPTALLIANSGIDVVGYDINEARVISLNQGHCPFNEPGLSDLLTNTLKSGNFKASTLPVTADAYIVAVPTPHLADGTCDTQYIESALRKIKNVVGSNSIIIIESTIAPGTSLNIIHPLLKQFGLAATLVHCPERAIPGNTIYELVHNDRIIGADDQVTAAQVKQLYKSFVMGEIFDTDIATAEAVKVLENTYRDVNIALANEFSKVLGGLGIDPIKAISLANRHPRVNILAPGPGVGGHCIAVDPWFLIKASPDAHLIKMARHINENRPVDVLVAIQRLQTVPGKIGVLGLAYKANVDDMRESPSLVLIELLEKAGYQVKASDSYVQTQENIEMLSLNELDKWADLLVLVTHHDDILRARFSTRLLDTRGVHAGRTLAMWESYASDQNGTSVVSA